MLQNPLSTFDYPRLELETGVLENRLVLEQMADELERVENLIDKQEAYQDAKDEMARSMRRIQVFPRSRYNITKQNMESAEKYLQNKSSMTNEKENSNERYIDLRIFRKFIHDKNTKMKALSLIIVICMFVCL